MAGAFRTVALYFSFAGLDAGSFRAGATSLAPATSRNVAAPAGTGVMRHAITKNMVGGGVLALFGTFFAVYALVYLKVGTFAQMGPGLFPALIGAILAGIGGLLLVTELLRAGARTSPPRAAVDRIEWRSLAAVIAAMAAFAMLISTFGLVPAIVALVAIASLAGDRVRPLAVIGLSAGLLVTVYLVFILALDLSIPMLRWPFS